MVMNERTSRARIFACALVLSAAAIACAPDAQLGAVTAHLQFPEPPGKEGTTRKALRLNVVPLAVARLQILAYEVDGSTLAETNLFAFPATENELRLDPTGGTWRLEQIPIGPN